MNILQDVIIIKRVNRRWRESARTPARTHTSRYARAHKRTQAPWADNLGQAADRGVGARV